MTSSNKFTRLFWSGGTPATPARAPAPAPAVVPVGPSRPTLVRAPTDDTTDFAAVYAATGSAGDPRVDQVLAAFEGMRAAMPATQLAVAMTATAAAIGASPALIVETASRRLAALDAMVTDERRKAAERHAARATDLEAATAAAQHEIGALEGRITALRQQLDAATASVRDKDAAELGEVAGLDQRARAEAARLIGLREFLAPHAAAARKKTG